MKTFFIFLPDLPATQKRKKWEQNVFFFYFRRSPLGLRLDQPPILTFAFFISSNNFLSEHSLGILVSRSHAPHVILQIQMHGTVYRFSRCHSQMHVYYKYTTCRQRNCVCASSSILPTVSGTRRGPGQKSSPLDCLIFTASTCN